jgi:hypothetical protein
MFETLSKAKNLYLTVSHSTERAKMIPGEMVNLQKVNLPKKVNSLKPPTIAFWLFYAQVDFLAS